jgi:hypothetical protein
VTWWLLKAIALGLLYGVASEVLKALFPASCTRADRMRSFAISFFLLFACALWVLAADILFSSDHAGAATPRDATFVGIFFIFGGFAMAGFAVAAAANKTAGSG